MQKFRPIAEIDLLLQILLIKKILPKYIYAQVQSIQNP